MNYDLHYNRLMDRATSRPKPNGYLEKHHKVPRCLGGSNAKKNIVFLTPEEHYVAHLLLVKMHPGHIGLLWAAIAMTNQTRRMPRKNKIYGWLRRKFSARMSQMMRGRVHSEESRMKMSLSRRGKKRGPHSDETKAKMSAASKGRPKSESHREALSKAKQGKKLPPRSPEWLANQIRAVREAVKLIDRSYQRTDEYRQRQAESMRRIWMERKSRQSQSQQLVPSS